MGDREAIPPADLDALRSSANEVLPAGSDYGAVGDLGDRDMEEALQVFYAAAANDPHREVSIMRHRRTGKMIIIQGDESGIAELTEEALRDAIGDHEMLDGTGDWHELNWDYLIHSHPVDEVTGVAGDYGRIPSWEDLNQARLSAVQSVTDPEEHTIFSSYVSIETELGTERIYYEYNTKTNRFMVAGRLPVAGAQEGMENWRFSMRYYEGLRQYVDEMYRLVGVESNLPPGRD